RRRHRDGVGPRAIPCLWRRSDEGITRWPDAFGNGWREGKRRMVSHSDADGCEQTAVASLEERTKREADLEETRRSIGQNGTDNGTDRRAERRGMAIQSGRGPEADPKVTD